MGDYTMHTSAIATLEFITETFTPRLACNMLILREIAPDNFWSKIMPAAMKAAGVCPDVRCEVWNDTSLEFLDKLLRVNCREDLMAEIEAIKDSDIYDGAGGYAHNSDDGSEMHPDTEIVSGEGTYDSEVIFDESDYNDPDFGYEATNLHEYLVTFTNGQVFRCWADDKDHAIEQANDAEPELYIDSVEEVN